MTQENTEQKVEAPEVVNEAPQVKEPKEVRTAGVQFQVAGQFDTFLCKDLELSIKDKVIVDGELGERLGSIIVEPKSLPYDEVSKKINKIIRKATAQDIEKYTEVIEKSLDSYEICQERIVARNLPMKLVYAEYSNDNKKATFYFSAEGRIDFRELVKELASLLHTRIEMRQIGARDESKYLGALGPCGRCTCCSTHLREFQSISIQMAKNQGLSPNPTKLTGMCNKLKCCLFYENACYQECRKELPREGNFVETSRGRGKVVGVNCISKICDVFLEEHDEIMKFPSKELKVIPKKN